MTNAISDFDFNEMVTLRGSEVITTSFNVAKHFNKQHKDVLKAIRRLQTNTRQYKNMVITSIGLSQRQNTVSEFTLIFREILIVDTQIATGLKIPRPRVRNLGKTQPQEIKTTSSAIEKTANILRDEK